MTERALHASIPSVDRLLKLEPVEALVIAYGRGPVIAALRTQLDALRQTLAAKGEAALADAEPARIVAAIASRLEAAAVPSLRPVFNLTGTVLHTNLGRALLPAEAIAAMAQAAANAVNLEFDIEAGRRGDRDTHLEHLLSTLTGAEKATVVNNNAAAVLLVLNTLADRREVIVSRGELIEIGGEFRMPEIMKRAGCRLVEVGTTNRTHLRDYADAIGSRTAVIMKVHTSNYRIVGFTNAVTEAELAPLARESGVILLSDLGAGALLDLRRWNLPHEPTVSEMISAGVDVITFSGDKLLGGPQAGFIAGRAELLKRITKNAMKRSLRVDKLRIAALEALLKLYEDPDRLAQRLPTLRHLTRAPSDIEAQAERLRPALEQSLAGVAKVSVERCESQPGSGSLPGEGLASFALALRPAAQEKRKAPVSRVESLALAFRSLPKPVIGRIHEGVLYLDLRCLDDEAAFTAQLGRLRGLEPRQ